MNELDQLFALLAGQCGVLADAYREAQPTPSTTTDDRHEQLIEAYQDLAQLVVQIEEIFLRSTQ